jgi:hypothetical protein
MTYTDATGSSVRSICEEPNAGMVGTVWKASESSAFSSTLNTIWCIATTQTEIRWLTPADSGRFPSDLSIVPNISAISGAVHINRSNRAISLVTMQIVAQSINRLISKALMHSALNSSYALRYRA